MRRPSYTFEYLRSVAARLPGLPFLVESAGYSVTLHPSDEEMFMGKKKRDKAMIERFRSQNGGEMPLFRMTIDNDVEGLVAA